MDKDNSVLLLNTVSEKREGFTRREYDGAQEARRAMHLLGFLSEWDFENMVRSNIIVICPVTFDDVKTLNFFGPDITSLKGKSVRRKPDSLVTDYVDIPREILKSDNELEVSMDIMLIKKLPFLVSITPRHKFTTIEYLASRKKIAPVTSINKIVSYYESHSLHAGMMFVDPKLQLLEEKVDSTTLNTTESRDHVPEV